ncbi:MAG: hypothetical protein SCL54_17755, partial [Bacillota bacterium]|nr:hypothetical protein [Bacillota bacterium]
MRKSFNRLFFIIPILFIIGLVIVLLFFQTNVLENINEFMRLRIATDMEREPEKTPGEKPITIGEPILDQRAYASAYGMVPNDSSAANHNAARFNEAL